jgi:hypothetical protein
MARRLFCKIAISVDETLGNLQLLSGAQTELGAFAIAC